MRVQNLTSSLAFGAAAAISFVFARHLAGPLLGSTNVFVFYLAGCTVAYAAMLGATPRRATRNAAAAFFGAGFVVLFSSGTAALVIGLCSVLGLVRSGLEYSTKGARGLAIEMLLGGLGLGFAGGVTSPGWLGDAAGLWAFALVQSLYFLVPGRNRKNGENSVGNPFERARERLLCVLEEG